MHNNGKLETRRFRGPSFINKKAPREKIIHNNNKHGKSTKDFKNNIDTSSSGSPRTKLFRHKPKVNSVRFGDPYDHINPTENTNDETHLINAYEEHTIEDYR